MNLRDFVSVLQLVHALHNPANAPRTNTFEFRSLPSGTYQVKAMLIGIGNEPRATVRQQVSVIANGTGR